MTRSRAARVFAAFAVALPLAAGALAWPAPARAEPPLSDTDAKDRSRASFRKGVAQARAQDWAGARQSFEAAWALYPHPSILLNLGIACLRTGDPVVAEQDFVRFLSEDFGATQEELASARDALAEAKKSLGTLRVVVTPETARVTIDGQPAALTKRDPGVVAETREKVGRHRVVVDAEGFTTANRDVDVAAQGEVEVKVALATGPAAEHPAPAHAEGPALRTIAGYGLGGLSAAALVTGAVFGLRATSLADDYNSRSSSRFQDAHTRSIGITFRTGADVAFGVAILSAAGAVVLLFTDLGKGPASALAEGPVLRW